MGGLAWEGAAVARPWPGLQMPGLCNTRSTSSRKACIPDVYVGYIEKGEFGSNSAVESYDTCSTPVLSLALVSTKIMLYLPRWMLHGEKENWVVFKKKSSGTFLPYSILCFSKITFPPNPLPPAPQPSDALHDHICCPPKTWRIISSCVK